PKGLPSRDDLEAAEDGRTGERQHRQAIHQAVRAGTERVNAGRGGKAPPSPLGDLLAAATRPAAPSTIGAIAGALTAGALTRHAVDSHRRSLLLVGSAELGNSYPSTR